MALGAPVSATIPELLKVEIKPSQDTLTVGSGFSVYVQITNESLTSEVSILGAEPLFPPQFVQVGVSGDNPDAVASVLQPGDSIQRQFWLRHKSAPFFAPSTRQLGFNIRYGVGAKEGSIAREIDLNLRPPLSYLLVGAVVGALLAFFIVSYGPLFTVLEGSASREAVVATQTAEATRAAAQEALVATRVVEELAKQGVIPVPDEQTADADVVAAPVEIPTGPRLLGSMIVSVVVGMIAVVAGQFTRRGITVEDFWGGVIIAFAVVLASSQLVGLAQGQTVPVGGLVPAVEVVIPVNNLDEFLQGDDVPATPQVGGDDSPGMPTPLPK